MSTHQIKKASQKGFTLVELSIVILIIGLLIAGIAAGTQMIRQAELRSIISDFYNFTIAYNNFQTKFKAVPGDFNAGTAFFTDAACVSTGTCNGNNNGLIDYATSGNTNEVNLAWEHLALGKVLGGSFSLVDRSSAVTNIGTNAPQSKRAGLGYILINETSPGNSANSVTAVFDLDKNVIFLGKARSTSTLFNSSLTPEDAFNIDQKMDDAYADTTSVSGSTVFRGIDTGVVRSKNGDDGTTGTAICTATVGTFKSYNIGVSPTPTSCRLGASVN